MKCIRVIALFPLLTGLFLNLGCNDERPVTFPPIPQELQDFGAFKEGTFWIYEEETSKRVDTFTVFLQETWQQEGKRDELATNQGIITHISTSLKHDTLIFEIHANNFGSVRYESRKLGPSYGYNSFYFASNTPLSRVIVFPNDRIIRLDTFLDSLRVLQNTFDKVRVTTDRLNPVFDDTFTRLFACRNFGIVRIEFPDKDEVWNLKEFNIVQ